MMDSTSLAMWGTMSKISSSLWIARSVELFVTFAYPLTVAPELIASTFGDLQKELIKYKEFQ